MTASLGWSNHQKVFRFGLLRHRARAVLARRADGHIARAIRSSGDAARFLLSLPPFTILQAHALDLTAAINLYVDFNWVDHGVLRH